MRLTRSALLASEFVSAPVMVAPLWTERLIEKWRVAGGDPMATVYPPQWVESFLASAEGKILAAMGGIVLDEQGALVATRIMALCETYAARQVRG